MPMVTTERCESALGTWQHSRWEPGADEPLGGLVERIWDFEGVLAFPRERTFPDGTLALVVQLDEPHRPVEPVPLAPFPAVCFDGLKTTTATIEGPRGFCRVTGIVMRPLGASALLRSSLREVTDRSIDLHEALGAEAGRIRDRLGGARDGAERVRRARAWIERRLANASAPEPLVARVLAHIERGAGDVACSHLDGLTGRSRSRLTAAFGDAVGLTPKRYARVLRFRRALELVTAGTPLADVAHRCGYYDQPHMNAEFAAHASLSPRAYADALRYPGSAHLAVP